MTLRADLGAFLLIIGAAAAWALSNIVTRKAAPPDTLRFMVFLARGEPIHAVDVIGGVLVIGGILIGLARRRPAGRRHPDRGPCRGGNYA
ncbi:hypothetical protein ACFQS1_04520 [Paractinoplanes rhizophilus]|uniref:EamA-like transporter family protein n=1 Tax=Paractinoplanes rhizophilus TaxID=1416877 RepID=A0ABW2HN34_9ACTN